VNACRPLVVGGLRNVQDPQDETGREVIGPNEADDHLRVGPISLAKYALATRSTSLTRCSSSFSRASRAFSARMPVVGRSCRSPASTSACRTQLRRASGCTFSCSPNRRHVGLGSDPRYSRTARSRSSSGYFLGAGNRASFLVLKIKPVFGDSGEPGKLRLRGQAPRDGCRGRTRTLASRCERGKRHGQRLTRGGDHDGERRSGLLLITPNTHERVTRGADVHSSIQARSVVAEERVKVESPQRSEENQP
jgi:hypothetical protein